MGMAELDRVGTETISGWELYVVEAGRPDDVPSARPLSSRFFVALIACDATSVSDDELIALVRKLGRAGCVYVCCWGPDCERVHDIFDRADHELRPNGPIAMSTWHDHEPLSDALWFVLFNSYPDDAFQDECRAVVGITIGAPEWATAVRSAFSNPTAFSARVLESERGG
jgi:hypothetical protein